MSPTVKASLWFVACNILQKGISFFTMPLFTAIMPETEYGLFSVFQSWHSVILIFATLNLHYQVYNNGAIKYENRTHEYVTAIIGLAWSACFIVFAIFSMLHFLWKPITGMPLRWMLYMALECAMIMPYSVFLCRERMSNHYKMVVLITLLMFVSSTGLGLLMVKTHSGSADSRILSSTIVNTAIGLPLFIYLFSKGHRLYDKEIWKYALNLAIPLIPHYLATVVLTSADRIMIGRMCGNDKVALYSVANSLGMLMQFVVSSVNAAVNPWIYRTMANKNYKALRKGTGVLYLLMALATILPTLFGVFYMRWFMKPSYYEATELIGIIAAGSFFTYIYTIFLTMELFFEKTKYTSLASIIAAMVNIILNYIGIIFFGYKAAAYTTLICYIIMTFAHYYFLRKASIQKNVDIVELVDIKIVACIGILVCGLSVLISSIASHVM